MASAKQHVQAFHGWHSARTFSAGHPEIDPWMRDVLIALQVCVNELADQIDSNTQRLDRLENWARKQ